MMQVQKFMAFVVQTGLFPCDIAVVCDSNTDCDIQHVLVTSAGFQVECLYRHLSAATARETAKHRSHKTTEIAKATSDNKYD